MFKLKYLSPPFFLLSGFIMHEAIISTDLFYTCVNVLASISLFFTGVYFSTKRKIKGGESNVSSY